MDENFEQWENLYVSLPEGMKDCNSTNLNDDSTTSVLKTNDNNNQLILKRKTDCTEINISSVSDFVTDFSSIYKLKNTEELCENRCQVSRVKSFEEAKENDEECSLFSPKPNISENVSSPSLIKSNDDELVHLEKIQNSEDCNNNIESSYYKPESVIKNDCTTSNDGNDLKTALPTQSPSLSDIEDIEIGDGELKSCNFLSDNVCEDLTDKVKENSDDSICEIVVLSPDQPHNSPCYGNQDSSKLQKSRRSRQRKGSIKKIKWQRQGVSVKKSPKKRNQEADEIKCLSQNVNKRLIQRNRKPTKPANTLAKQPMKCRPQLSPRQVADCKRNQLQKESICETTCFQRLVNEETKVIAKVEQKLNDIQNSYIRNAGDISNIKTILDKLYTVLKKIESNQIQQLVSKPMLSLKAAFLKKASFLQSTLSFHQSVSFKVQKWKSEEKYIATKSNQVVNANSKKRLHQNFERKKESASKGHHHREIFTNVTGKTVQGSVLYDSSLTCSDKETNKIFISPKPANSENDHNMKCKKRRKRGSQYPSSQTNKVLKRFSQQKVPLSQAKKSSHPISNMPNSQFQFPVGRSMTVQNKTNVESDFHGVPYMNPDMKNMLASSYANSGIPVEAATNYDYLEFNRFQNAAAASSSGYEYKYPDHIIPLLHRNRAGGYSGYSHQNSWPVQNTSQMLVNNIQDYTLNSDMNNNAISFGTMQNPELQHSHYSFHQVPEDYTMSSIQANCPTILNEQNNDTFGAQSFRESEILGANSAANQSMPINALTLSNVHHPWQLKNHSSTITSEYSKDAPKPTPMQQYSMPADALTSNEKVLNWIRGQNLPVTNIHQNTTSIPAHANSKIVTVGGNKKFQVPLNASYVKQNVFEVPKSRSINKGIQGAVSSASIAVNTNILVARPDIEAVAEDLSVKKKECSNNNNVCLNPTPKKANVSAEDIVSNSKSISMKITNDKIIETKSIFQKPFTKATKLVKANDKELSRIKVITFPSKKDKISNKSDNSHSLISTKGGKKSRKTKISFKKNSSRNSQDVSGLLNSQKNATSLNQENCLSLIPKVPEQNTEATSDKTSPSSYIPNINWSSPSPSFISSQTSLSLLQNDLRKDSNDILKDIINVIPEAVMNDVQLPSVLELIKTGTIPCGDNILSVVTPDGTKYAALDYYGFIVSSDGLIFNTVIEWCQSMSSLSSPETHLSISTCYEKVLCNNQPLMSFCHLYNTKENATDSENISTSINKIVNQIAPFSHLDYHLNFNDLAKMKILPIGDNEIGPVPPFNQWDDIDK